MIVDFVFGQSPKPLTSPLPASGERERLASLLNAHRGGDALMAPLPVKTGRGEVRGQGFRLRLVLFFLTLLLPLAAHALTPGEMLADPALEARARAITMELRCLVCQNQSIDDSDASLAKDLRVLVREKLKEGMSDAQVREYVHSRYGDFVLLRPPMKPGTLLLWSAPLIALLAGAAAVWMAARRRREVVAAPPAELTAEERARLEALGVARRSEES
jgi:cytochrome c-type biogenesis protein CcmH